MKYQEIYDLILEGKSFEDIAIKTGIPIPELQQTIPLVYEQINREYSEKAPNAAAINYARLEVLIQAIMTKVPEANARDLVSLSNALSKLIEEQDRLKNEIRTQKPLIAMAEIKTEEKPKIINNEEKNKTFLQKYGDKMGSLAPGERGLLESMQPHDDD